MLRAIRRNRKAGKPTDFWHLRLPRETVTYVPKLLALVDIVSRPQEFNLELPTLEDRPYFDVVELDGQMDLALIAELADPDGPHRAVVPTDRAGTLAAALAELPGDARMRWVRYRIRSGDSLIAVAQRHGTTPDVIRQVNGIRGNVIRAGDHLMIPTATRSLSAYTQSADLRLAQSRVEQRSDDALAGGRAHSGPVVGRVVHDRPVGDRVHASAAGQLLKDSEQLGPAVQAPVTGVGLVGRELELAGLDNLGTTPQDRGHLPGVLQVGGGKCRGKTGCGEDAIGAQRLDRESEKYRAVDTARQRDHDAAALAETADRDLSLGRERLPI